MDSDAFEELCGLKSEDMVLAEEDLEGVGNVGQNDEPEEKREKCKLNHVLEWAWEVEKSILLSDKHLLQSCRQVGVTEGPKQEQQSSSTNATADKNEEETQNNNKTSTEATQNSNTRRKREKCPREALELSILSFAESILGGDYVQVAADEDFNRLLLSNSVGKGKAGEQEGDSSGDSVSVLSWLKERVTNYVEGQIEHRAETEGPELVLRALKAELFAVACFNLFLQANYTGPALEEMNLDGVYPLPFYLSLDNTFAQLCSRDSHSDGRESNNNENYNNNNNNDDDEDDNGVKREQNRESESGQEQLQGVGNMTKEQIVSPLSEEASSHLQRESLKDLQVDGETTHTLIKFPHYFVVARGVLAALSSYQSEAQNEISKMRKEQRVLGQLLGAQWWNARAIVTHQRLIIASDPVQSLFNEASRTFDYLIEEVQKRNTERNVTTSYSKQIKNVTNANILADNPENNQERQNAAATYYHQVIYSMLYLERGLMEHHFDKKSRAKATFALAVDESGIEVELTGAMGKRTRFQQEEIAQLVVGARSTLLHKQEQLERCIQTDKKVANGQKTTARSVAEAEEGSKSLGEETTKQIEEEEGVEVTGATESGSSERNEGEERESKRVERGRKDLEVRFEDVDPDNPLLEKIQVQAEAKKEGFDCQLHPLDQAILLALCIDVANHNPKDGLTSEQMAPYIARVLENPNNWMIHSTGLLEKSWLEFERSHARERAALQLQAIVDQHSNRLTLTQSTSKAIEESAPVQDRLKHLHSLVFPPQWELKEGLAQRYSSLGVFRSALEIFLELEMWDAVVECYSVLGETRKAEEMVRARLAVNPTPYMYCALGDLTQEEEFYLKSWEISGKKYARAKRSLASALFRKDKVAEAAVAMREALSVNSNYPRGWFQLGVMSMVLDRPSEALSAFSRVIREEPENAEAWGNIGGIHLSVGNFEAAFAALKEALKHKRENWRMWENFLMCCVESEKFGDAIYAMHRLLDLKDKHQRPVDVEYLAVMVEAIAHPESYAQYRKQKKKAKEEGAGGETEKTAGGNEEGEDEATTDGELSEESGGEENSDALGGRELYRPKLAELLGRISANAATNAKIWQVYARYYEGVGDASRALDCRVKECRALQKAGWEKDAKMIEEVAKGAQRLFESYEEVARTMQDRPEERQKFMYKWKMFLAGMVRRIDPELHGLEGFAMLSKLQDESKAKFGL